MPPGRLPIAAVLGILGDEVLLQARYEVTRPVDLAPEQRGEGAGVRGIDGEVDALDLRRPLPEVRGSP